MIQTYSVVLKGVGNVSHFLAITYRLHNEKGQPGFENLIICIGWRFEVLFHIYISLGLITSAEPTGIMKTYKSTTASSSAATIYANNTSPRVETVTSNSKQSSSSANPKPSTSMDGSSVAVYSPSSNAGPMESSTTLVTSSTELTILRSSLITSTTDAPTMTNSSTGMLFIAIYLCSLSFYDVIRCMPEQRVLQWHAICLGLLLVHIVGQLCFLCTLDLVWCWCSIDP